MLVLPGACFNKPKTGIQKKQVLETCRYASPNTKTTYIIYFLWKTVYIYIVYLMDRCIHMNSRNLFNFHSLHHQHLLRKKGVPDRAAKRFFSTAILRPSGGTAYPAVSQKVLSATSCRYMIMWCASLVAHFDLHDQNHLWLGSLI